jgi:hypothetical protein
MVLNGSGANGDFGMANRKKGRADVCPLGGNSPVITTISYGELLLTDLCPIPVKSCMRGLPRDGGPR